MRCHVPSYQFLYVRILTNLVLNFGGTKRMGNVECIGQNGVIFANQNVMVERVSEKLTVFNRALLSKQVWRIIQAPNALMAKVIKARYFKHSDIMAADLGTNPSFVWRSLLWGCGLINKYFVGELAMGKTFMFFQNLGS